MLISLNFLSQHGIIHCDLKPENVLLKSNDTYNVKVIDFGSSCFINERMYSYIQSRFYRAPEIILGINYGLEIDMWSFGCILAELYSGIPIFPGEDETDQLFYMMEYFGVPSLNMLKISKKRKFFFNDDFTPKKIQNSRGKVRIPNTKKIYKFLMNSDPNLRDLIEKCLIWEPNKRIKPGEGLLHPYILERYQKEVYQIFKNKTEDQKFISKKIVKENILKCNDNNHQKNNQTMNLNYYNNHQNKNISISEEKININININSINNCRICQNGKKDSNIDYHNENFQYLQSTTPDKNYIELNKIKNDYEKIIDMNSISSTSKNHNKKSFIRNFTKNSINNNENLTNFNKIKS